MTNSGNILWADDEIDLLKPHILFLESKGYLVQAVTNGLDALEKVQESYYDMVFLDENMPGLSGLDTLTRIKEIKPNLPVVMITKSEEEHIMEDAIGSKIADYLIKPVNQNQILISLKKNLQANQLVSDKTSLNYQQEFRQLGMLLNNRLDVNEWKELYAKLVYWELQLDKIEDSGMSEIFEMQKKEANQQFSGFIEDNYLNWLNGVEEGPVFVHNLIKDRVFKRQSKAKTLVLVIDNLRYDQWKVLEPVFNKYFVKEKEEVVFSILPTATQYARNAFFAGLMPSEIAKKHPQYWKNEEDEGSKNLFEKELLDLNLKRLGKSSLRYSYNKITNVNAGKKLVEQFHKLKENDMNFLVYNFVDMLSHARTDMEVIRELADDESAYRSLTISWLEHSPLLDVIKKAAEERMDLIVTTDHGTIKVNQPVKIAGQRNTNTNLRYKVGRGLGYKEKDVFVVREPQDGFLPRQKMSSEFVFAKEQDFFVYPNNYNHFVNYYGNTFQHGGISMEEIMIPYIEMKAK